jgi:brefeldin A-resistance guanine nucleotide exchange factor 1
VFELLRVCRQTLPGLDVENDAGDAALAEDLLDATRLTFALEPAVADALIARVAHELEALIEALETDDWRAGRLAAERIRTARGWDTVCKLLTATARHPDAAARGFEALARVVAGAPNRAESAPVGESSDASDETVTVTSEKTVTSPYRSHARPWNVRSCLEATSAFVDAHQGGDERSARALALLGCVAESIGEWCGGERDGGAIAVAAAMKARESEVPSIDHVSPLEALELLRRDMLTGPFSDIVSYLRRVATIDARATVRDDAALTLQRALSGGDALGAPPEYWARCFAPDGVLTGMLREMCARFGSMPARSPERIASERTAHLAVSCAAKTFLAKLPATSAAEPVAFAEAWFALLDALRAMGEAATCEELREAVPEAAKNMLLVMSAQGVLAPGAPQGLWEETWKRAAAVEPSLTPAIVGAK